MSDGTPSLAESNTPGIFCEHPHCLLAVNPATSFKSLVYGGVRPVHRLRQWAQVSFPSLTPHSSPFG